ncbi:lipid-A-disaccharide synthase [Phycisphaerae bacterium RAS1]|nr:lipid-A-disaccharide synthase [Phycisphaerae bacterium RAS1]
MLTLAAFTIESFFQKLGQPLVLFGFAGQFVFMLRFVVQWLSSERRGRSHVPIGFWYLSLAGGLMLLIYGWLDEDPVIMVGQGLGLAIYVRNLMLIHRERARGSL